MNEEIERYNVVGNELRKLELRLDKDLGTLGEGMAEILERIAQVQQNQQLILQKMDELKSDKELEGQRFQLYLAMSENVGEIRDTLAQRDKRKEKKRKKR